MSVNVSVYTFESVTEKESMKYGCSHVSDWPCWSAASRRRTVLSLLAHRRWCRPRHKSWCADNALTALKQREREMMVRDREMAIMGRLRSKCECPHCRNSWCPPQTLDEEWTRPSVGVNHSSPIPWKTSAASLQTLHLFTRVNRSTFIDNPGKTRCCGHSLWCKNWFTLLSAFFFPELS